MTPRLLPLAAFLLAVPLSAEPSPDVLTYHNDNARTGQYLAESTLMPRSVTPSTFGRLFSREVDGQIYAQPLYMADVEIKDKGRHNVVFVVTQHDSLYALDADSADGPNKAPLWQVSFIDPSNQITTVPNGEINSADITPEIGICSTPVIDPYTRTIYVLSKVKEELNQITRYVQRLHAIDVSSGKDKYGSPVVIQAAVPGTGDGAIDGVVPFHTRRQFSRAAMLLVHGTLYLSFASHGDNGPYHGWVMAYEPQTLNQIARFNTSPNSSMSGLWSAGCGPAADDVGNLFFMTGNGHLTAQEGGKDFGDAFVKLSTAGGRLECTDWFSPFNQEQLEKSDADLGSGACILLPDQPGPHPHLLIGAGKEGKAYLIDRDNMGRFDPKKDNVVQTLPGAAGGGSFDAPAYFNGAVYYMGAGDVLKAFPLKNGRLAKDPSSKSRQSYGFPGATPSISANGDKDGVVWTLQNGNPPVLHAHDAADLSRELYNSGMNFDRDHIPSAGTKFSLPTVARGKVYVGSQKHLTAFGPLPSIAAPQVADALKIPAGHTVLIHAKAKGTQTYTCVKDEAGESTWALTSSQADLLDDHNRKIAHFRTTLNGGIEWEAKDGSRLAADPLRQTADAALYKTNPSTSQNTGILSRVTFIHRLKQQGGLPPTGDPSPAQTRTSEFTADYYFYAPAH